jgi:hypothetical protein
VTRVRYPRRRRARLLLRQLTAPVRWTEVVRAIAADHPDALFVEMGSGRRADRARARRSRPGADAPCGTAAEVDALLADAAPAPDAPPEPRPTPHPTCTMNSTWAPRAPRHRAARAASGRAIAETLAACGATVAVVGRDQARPRPRRRRSGRARARLRVRRRGRPRRRRARRQRGAALGACDILVNNAGPHARQPADALKDDDWDAVIDANLRGAFATMRAASRGMMKRRWGRIINIASVVGLTGTRGRRTTPRARPG